MVYGVQLVFEDRYFRLILFILTFTTFIFQKLIITDLMLTNEMKRYAVIAVLKADRGDLEIARFLRVARSFVHKIRKELKKNKKQIT